MTAEIKEHHWYEMSILIDDTMYKEKGVDAECGFYSATVYYSMGIPIDLYTPIFAASRIAGWCAHAMEQYANNRIYRPRGQWKGLVDQKWIPAVSAVRRLVLASVFTRILKNELPAYRHFLKMI